MQDTQFRMLSFFSVSCDSKELVYVVTKIMTEMTTKTNLGHLPAKLILMYMFSDVHILHHRLTEKGYMNKKKEGVLMRIFSVSR